MSASEENNSNNNNNIIPLAQSTKLQQTGIVDSFIYDPSHNCLQISLNHVYDRIKIIVTVNKKDWSKTTRTFLDKLKRYDISSDHIKQLEYTLDNNYDKIVKSQPATAAVQEEQQQQRQQQSAVIEKETDKDDEKMIPIISIPEAARITEDNKYIKTQGIITTVIPLRKLPDRLLYRCLDCNTLNGGRGVKLSNGKPHLYEKPKEPRECLNCKEGTFTSECIYCNAILIELRDPNTFSDIDPLHAVLFDDDTKGVQYHLGELVTLTGCTYILENNVSAKHRSLTYLYVENIKYERNQREIVLSAKDIEAITRFTDTIEAKYRQDPTNNNNKNIVDVLAGLFATNVIGEFQAKKAIILAAASTGLDKSKSKLDTALIGPPGLAKSELLRKAVELVPGSRFESVQTSTGKGLTATVTSKEGEGMILTTGAVPAAKGGIAALNELGKLSPDDQKYLLDIMQEQEFTVNKADIHARVDSPTLILASCNPIRGTWEEDLSTGEDIIDLNDFPAIVPLKDRFDLIIPIKAQRDENKNRQYAHQKLLNDEREPPDYIEYLKKHIQYCKRFNPKLSDETMAALEDYYVHTVSKSRNWSRRPLDTIKTIAKMIARLKLKSIVDFDDAKETIEYYNGILQGAEYIVSDPRETTTKAFLDILERNKNSTMTPSQLYWQACDENPQVKHYLGTQTTIKYNKKLRDIIETIEQYGYVKEVQKKPKVLRWVDKDDGGGGDEEDGNNNNDTS